MSKNCVQQNKRSTLDETIYKQKIVEDEEPGCFTISEEYIISII